MPNCLVGCINDYNCGDPQRTPGIGVPEVGDLLAPWVIAEFSSGNISITVGNKSAPDFNHHAIISTMEWGWTTGYELTLEIFDEQGGAFDEFVDTIIKCADKPVDTNKILLSFGWIIQDCRGNITKVGGYPKIETIVMDLEVSFREGKIRYTITGKDPGQLIFSAREDEIWGQDDNRMSLKDAIKKLAKSGPKATHLTVAYQKSARNGGKATGEFGFLGFEDEGPRCVWDSDNENKISTIQKWFEPFRTNNNRGIFVTANTAKADEIIIHEDPTSPSSGGCMRALPGIGTFIVNAGSCSNVLEFSPKVNWMQAFSHLSTGANTGGSGTGESQTIEKEPQAADQGKKLGSQETIAISRYAWDCHGPKNAARETQISAQKHHKANRIINTGVINAELRIIGLPIPELLHLTGISRLCSIVVINPFHLDDSKSNGQCGEWLARPGCNKVLSNKNWIITGANHKIDKGKYETIIQLMLQSPSIDLDPGQAFGADPAGYQPKNTC